VGKAYSPVWRRKASRTQRTKDIVSIDFDDTSATQVDSVLNAFYESDSEEQTTTTTTAAATESDLVPHKLSSSSPSSSSIASACEPEPLYELTPECSAYLGSLTNWGLDIFALDLIAAGRPLTATVMAAFFHTKLFDNLPLDIVCGDVWFFHNFFV
jgi:hypothetical protein